MFLDVEWIVLLVVLFFLKCMFGLLLRSLYSCSFMILFCVCNMFLRDCCGNEFICMVEGLSFWLRIIIYCIVDKFDLF